MNTPNLIINIPEPCHEDWNNMPADNTGRYCSSCSTSVIDFTNKTDAEIAYILKAKSHEKVCGRFKPSQVNRPLVFSFNLKDLPRNVSATKAFAIALFLAFGTFLFSCTNYENKKLDKVETTTEHLMGDVLIFPTIDVEMSGVDSIPQTESAQTVTRAEYVASAIDQDSVPKKEKDIIDTAFFTEYAVMGGIEPTVAFLEPIDSTIIQIDSVQNLNTSIQEEQNRTNNFNPLNIFPNPTSGQFNVHYSVLKRVNVTLEVYDLSGNLVKTISNISNQYEGQYQIAVDLNQVPNGIYLVSLLKGNERFTEKVIIEK